MIIFGNHTDRIAGHLEELFSDLKSPLRIADSGWDWAIAGNQVLVFRRVGGVSHYMLYAHDVLLNDNRVSEEFGKERIMDRDEAIHWIEASWSTKAYGFDERGLTTYDHWALPGERSRLLIPLLQMLLQPRVDGKQIDQSLRILYPGYESDFNLTRIYLNGGLDIRRRDDQESATFEDLTCTLLMLRV